MNNKGPLVRSKITASYIPFEDGPTQGLSRARLHFMLYSMKTESATPKPLDYWIADAPGINTQGRTILKATMCLCDAVKSAEEVK